MFRQYARAPEFVPDMNAVRDVDCEGDGAPPFAEAVPGRDDVANQLFRVDALGQRALDVIAARNSDAFQVGPARCINPRRNAGTRKPSRVNSATPGHSTRTSNIFPRPRPSPLHGVAVRPIKMALGYAAIRRS